MPMKLEAWPGGRWYRDLGGNNGHFWGVVQAIKRPTLLEITGPLFMSYPVVSNVQYRLSEKDGGTLLTFNHTALGLILEDHREEFRRGGPLSMKPCGRERRRRVCGERRRGGVVPATGEKYVSILHRQRTAVGGKFDIGGRIDHARGDEVGHEERRK